LATSKFDPEKLVTWNANDGENIKHYLQCWLDALKPTDAGLSITLPFLVDVCNKILTHYIKLQGVINESDRKEFIRRAVITLKKSGSNDIKVFRKALADLIWEYSQVSKQLYYVLFPLHVASHSQSLKYIKVLGVRFLLVDWLYIHSRFKIDDFLTQAENHLAFVMSRSSNDYETFLQLEFVPLITPVYGRTEREAVDKASRAFDLLRSLLNLYNTFGTVRRHYGPAQQPLGNILAPSAFAVFGQDKSFSGSPYYNTLIYPRYPSADALTIDQVEQARKLSNRLGMPNDERSTLYILLDALEKYGQALDTTEWRLAFLTLWQILELLTLQGEGIQMKNVVSRVHNLLKRNKLFDDLLKVLLTTRNSLVHRGQFPDLQGLEEVGYLKSIVESVIDAIFAELDELPDIRSVELYYEFVSRSDADIQKQEHILKYIQERRSKTS